MSHASGFHCFWWKTCPHLNVFWPIGKLSFPFLAAFIILLVFSFQKFCLGVEFFRFILLGASFLNLKVHVTWQIAKFSGIIASSPLLALPVFSYHGIPVTWVFRYRLKGLYVFLIFIFQSISSLLFWLGNFSFSVFKIIDCFLWHHTSRRNAEVTPQLSGVEV